MSPSDLLDFVQPNGTNAVCTDPDIRHALKMGVNFRYRFFDKGRRYITAYTVTESVCEREGL